jgi:hypothetical protein
VHHVTASLINATLAPIANGSVTITWG